MESIKLPSEIIDYFASIPLPAHVSVGDVLKNGSGVISERLQRCMKNIPISLVNKRTRETSFHCNLPSPEKEEFARLELIEKAVSTEISKKRYKYLKSAIDLKRPKPYNESCLKYIPITSDQLVDLSSFISNRPRKLTYRGMEFQLLPLLPAANSSYWLKAQLFFLHSKGIKNIFIRLDPFMVQPQDTFATMEYRMWVYGRPLNMERLKSLKSDEHLRWLPDHPDYSPVAFTDLVWSPRDKDELHLSCEEVPKETRRAARYLHGILDINREEFIHTDGSIRLYSDAELEARKKDHVRAIGKIGQRVKIFRLEEAIKSEIITDVISSFFVWNDDIMNYFCNKN